MSNEQNDDKPSSHCRPSTLAEALAILKAIHNLSPAEQRDIDEAIRCIGAFDGVTDYMVECALGAAGETTINFRPPWHDDEKATVRAMLEAVIEASPPTSVRSAISLPKEPTEEIIDAMAEGYTAAFENPKMPIGENMKNVYRALWAYVNRSEGGKAT